MRFVSESEKISGNGFVIINAENNISDSIIGTIGSIIANSPIYEEGTIIITMAYYEYENEEKIKISARTVGKPQRNLKKLLEEVIKKTGGNFGGHEFAAGGLIVKEKEKEFLELLKKSFEVELIKV